MELRNLFSSYWSDKLDLSDVPFSESLIANGADSVDLLEFLDEMQALGIGLDQVRFLASPTIETAVSVSSIRVPNVAADITSSSELAMTQLEGFPLNDEIRFFQRYRTVMQVVIEFDGLLKADRLGSAIQSVTERHAILQCVIDTNRLVYDPSINRQLEEHELASQSEREALLTELASRIQKDREQSLIFSLMHQNDRSTLVITYDHVLMDGYSRMTALFTDLRGAYRTAAPYPTLPSKEKFSFLNYLNLRDPNQASPEDLSHFTSAFATAPTMLRQQENVEQSEPTLALSRTNVTALRQSTGVTLTTLIHTHIVLALLHLEGGSIRQNMIAYKFRYSDRTPEVAGLSSAAGSFTAVAPLAIEISNETSVDRLQLQISAQIALAKKHGHGMAFGKLFRSQGLARLRWSSAMTVDVSDYSSRQFQDCDWGDVRQVSYQVGSVKPGRETQWRNSRFLEIGFLMPGGPLFDALTVVPGLSKFTAYRSIRIDQGDLSITIAYNPLKHSKQTIKSLVAALCYSLTEEISKTLNKREHSSDYA